MLKKLIYSFVFIVITTSATLAQSRTLYIGDVGLSLGMSRETVMKLLSPEKLLTPVRYGDAGADLWTTFNVVQEHLVRGGDRYMGYTEGMGVRRNRTRPVGGLNEGQKLNKALNSDIGVKPVIPTCR